VRRWFRACARCVGGSSVWRPPPTRCLRRPFCIHRVCLCHSLRAARSPWVNPLPRRLSRGAHCERSRSTRCWIPSPPAALVFNRCVALQVREKKRRPQICMVLGGGEGKHSLLVKAGR
jgi:hypothetical protein